MVLHSSNLIISALYLDFNESRGGPMKCFRKYLNSCPAILALYQTTNFTKFYDIQHRMQSEIRLHICAGCSSSPLSAV